MNMFSVVYSRRFTTRVDVQAHGAGMMMRYRCENHRDGFFLKGECRALYAHDSGTVLVVMEVVPDRSTHASTRPVDTPAASDEASLELIVIQRGGEPRVAFSWNRTRCPDVPGMTAMNDAYEPYVLKLLYWDDPCNALGVLLWYSVTEPGARNPDVRLASAGFAMTDEPLGLPLQLTEEVPIACSGNDRIPIDAAAIQGTPLLLMQWHWIVLDPAESRHSCVSEFGLVDSRTGRVVWRLAGGEYLPLTLSPRVVGPADFRMCCQASQVQGGHRSFALRSQDRSIERVFRIAPRGDWSSVDVTSDPYREMYAPPNWNLSGWCAD